MNPRGSKKRGERGQRKNKEDVDESKIGGTARRETREEGVGGKQGGLSGGS